MTPVLTQIRDHDEMRATWLQVRDRVQELSVKHDNPWIADDVWKELMVGNAYLWATPDLDGVMVMTLVGTTTHRQLGIWICLNRGEFTMADYWDQVLAIAEESGCKEVFWLSDRAGFERAIPGVRREYRYFHFLGG